MIEIIIRKQEQKGTTPYSPVPYVIAGALFLGIQILAGHVEITYYVLLVSAMFAIWRLIGAWLRLRSWRPLPRLAAWLAVMVCLGLGLSAIQLIPLFELARQSFREGSATLQQVRDWAWPSRQIITFFLPDFFGNPTHHDYFDIWRRVWTPVTLNALGQPLNSIDWGVKNYVEGGNYVGLMTMALAAVAALVAGARLKVEGVRSKGESGFGNVAPSTFQPSTFTVLGFALLALLSLLFAFGTPLYAVLFYLLPGYSQLHSAFRWVFPYTLSMAVLAGYGLSFLLGGELTPRVRKVVVALGAVIGLAGAAAVALVALSALVPGPFIAIGNRILASSDLARERGFADGAMAWSYEAINLLKFGAMAVLTGALLLWAVRRGGDKETWRQGESKASPRLRVTQSPQRRIWPLALIAVLILDLWLFGHSFNPAVDPKLLAFKPPVIQWLQDRRSDSASPWRLTSFDGPNEKTLNANSAMIYGLEDVRGYDSIIPKPYAEYMKRIQPQGELLYNRIAAIYTQLGDSGEPCRVEQPAAEPAGGALRRHHTDDPEPRLRAGLRRRSKGLRKQERLPAAPSSCRRPSPRPVRRRRWMPWRRSIRPRWSWSRGFAPDALAGAASPELREATISRYTPREIFVDVNLSDRGWLVLTDNFADGWKAYLRPFGATGEGVTASGESIEQQLPLYRADGAFRAVYIPNAGQWTVRFVYSPRSFILGLYVSFLAVITLILLGGWWMWGRLYRGDRSDVGRVAKNSAVQMVAALMTRAIDFAFAMLRLRLLGPAGEGAYAFAITFYATFEIITRFGLGTLMTRDIAKDRGDARRYLVNVIGLRTLLWLASLPIMLVVMLAYRSQGQLSPETAQAIGLFMAALFFANIADSLSAVFFAFEQMEYPAAIATATAVAKVALGALVLLPPFDMGFVGLAGVSLVMNIVQAIWLYVIMRRTVLPKVSGSTGETENGREGERERGHSPTRRLGLDWRLQRYMLGESGPLMINHLLASVFWRINLYVLQWFSGATSVGIFSAATKYIDGLNVIPAYFTIAIFPMMSRYAQGQSDALARAYRLAAQLLFILALPIAVAFTFLASPLIRILGGAAYLPDSAIALQIMIWSIPIGWVNSVTQYVLISVNQQRFLTRAFVIGVDLHCHRQSAIGAALRLCRLSGAAHAR